MPNKRNGFILISSFMVIAVLVILGAAFISKSLVESRIAQREQRFVQSIYLAEGGIDYALDQLRGGVSSGNNSAVLSAIGDYNCNWGRIGASFTWEIISAGTINEIQRTVRVVAQPDTFARYLYFTDDEHFLYYGSRIPVWFISCDYLGGPLQTNSHLHISGDPVFTDPNYNKPVKTFGNFITYMHGGPPSDNPQFQSGIMLGSEKAPFNSKALDLRTAAVHDGYHFEASGVKPAQITLNSNGTMTVTDSHRTNQVMPLPDNGAVFVTGGDVKVSGVLSGKLSIGTNRNVVITDNITYKDDPRTNPDSTDTLGLIAEKDVVISYYAPRNLEIDASILALGNSFIMENWWDGPAKDTLTVFGGIIQSERGPIGTFNSSTNTRISGYSKDYQYDLRLMMNPPPFYPVTGDYVILSWEEL